MKIIRSYGIPECAVGQRLMTLRWSSPVRFGPGTEKAIFLVAFVLGLRRRPGIAVGVEVVKNGPRSQQAPAGAKQPSSAKGGVEEHWTASATNSLAGWTPSWTREEERCARAHSKAHIFQKQARRERETQVDGEVKEKITVRTELEYKTYIQINLIPRVHGLEHLTCGNVWMRWKRTSSQAEGANDCVFGNVVLIMAVAASGLELGWWDRLGVMLIYAGGKHPLELSSMKIDWTKQALTIVLRL